MSRVLLVRRKRLICIAQGSMILEPDPDNMVVESWYTPAKRPATAAGGQLLSQMMIIILNAPWPVN